MPVVSQAITDAEWHSLEQEHNLDGKSKRQLGIEGHWLIDDATVEDRARVLELVPALPRAVLVHGLGPSYRRRRRACWNPSCRRVQHEGSTSVVVDADVDSVWEVVRDPARGWRVEPRVPRAARGLAGRPRRSRAPGSVAGTDRACSGGVGCARS